MQPVLASSQVVLLTNFPDDGLSILCVCVCVYGSLGASNCSQTTGRHGYCVGCASHWSGTRGHWECLSGVPAPGQTRVSGNIVPASGACVGMQVSVWLFSSIKPDDAASGSVSVRVRSQKVLATGGTRGSWPSARDTIEPVCVCVSL